MRVGTCVIGHGGDIADVRGVIHNGFSRGMLGSSQESVRARKD